MYVLHLQNGYKRKQPKNSWFQQNPLLTLFENLIIYVCVCVEFVCFETVFFILAVIHKFFDSTNENFFSLNIHPSDTDFFSFCLVFNQQQQQQQEYIATLSLSGVDNKTKKWRRTKKNIKNPKRKKWLSLTDTRFFFIFLSLFQI